MTNKEFSDNFDTLLNSFGTTPSIVVDEYEKSSFLTQAQEQLVKEYYTGNNLYRKSFEETEEIRNYLSELVETVIPDKLDNSVGLSENSTFYKRPDNLWFITYESVSLKDDSLVCLGESKADVIPVTQDDFFRVSNNPFKGPSTKRVLRLTTSKDAIELVSKYNINRYTLRYLRQPRPIILLKLSDLTINGISDESTCELNPVIHRDILERAVQLAITSQAQFSGK